MSKTITIPTNCNPYIVVINNHVYAYRAGDSVEVPDEVAEVIEDALELEPKPKRYLDKLAKRVDGSLTAVTFSDLDGVRAMVSSAFSYCKWLATVEIPESITSIGSSAFYNCPNLESVRFFYNGNLASIGSNAFRFCGKLKSVHLPITPPTLEDVNAFQDTNTTCVFYCKTQESLNAYKVAPNWSTLAGTYSFVVEA